MVGVLGGLLGHHADWGIARIGATEAMFGTSHWAGFIASIVGDFILYTRVIVGYVM